MCGNFGERQVLVTSWVIVLSEPVPRTKSPAHTAPAPTNVTACHFLTSFTSRMQPSFTTFRETPLSGCQFYLAHKLYSVVVTLICLFTVGHTVAQLVEALRYKPEGQGIDSPMVSLEFFIDIILPAALGPWGRLCL